MVVLKQMKTNINAKKWEEDRYNHWEEMVGYGTRYVFFRRRKLLVCAHGAGKNDSHHQ